MAHIYHHASIAFLLETYLAGDGFIHVLSSVLQDLLCNYRSVSYGWLPLVLGLKSTTVPSPDTSIPPYRDSTWESAQLLLYPLSSFYSCMLLFSDQHFPTCLLLRLVPVFRFLYLRPLSGERVLNVSVAMIKSWETLCRRP